MTAVVFGWFLPRKVRESRVKRERLTLETEKIMERTIRSSEATLRSADRLERAAAALMERHHEALVDAARELRRK